MPVAPLCNPYDFFRGGRNEAGLRELSHATRNQRTHYAALFSELQRVEGEGIASSVRQGRQIREPLRIIQYADHPEMIKSARRTGSINGMEREGNRVAGTVESNHLGFPEIIGFHSPTQLHGFHYESGKLRHPGTDVETAASPS